MADYRDHVMYAKHILLHCLILFLLNLVQCSYHGIVVAFVTKCLLHMHQKVLHGDIFAFIQGVGPFTWVPMETGKDMAVHTGLIILLKEGVHIKTLECVYHCTPGSVDLKIGISNLAGANHFSLLPLWPL